MSKAMPEPPEQEFQHWGRVYAGVIITLVIVIIALWAFSRAFS